MKRSRVLLVAGLLMASLPACFGGDPSSSPTTAPLPSTTAPATTTPSTSDSQPDPPSQGLEIRTTTLRVAPAALADREGLEVWSDPNETVALAISPDGSVWTVGPGGTTHWNVAGGSATVFTVDDGLGSSNGRALAIAANGTVFVAHGAHLSEGGNGVSVFDGDSWSHQTTADGLPSDSVLDLEVGADGTIWAASHAGLAYHSDGSWYLAEGSPAVYDLALSPTGELRAQIDDGVIVVDSPTEWRELPSEPLPGWEALPGEGAVVDQDGGWWLPLWGVGLVRSTADGMEVHIIDEHLEEYQQAAETGEIARAVLLPGLKSVFGVTVTSDGAVWAQGGPGILRLSNGEWLRVEGQGVSDALLHDARADGDGGHWLASDRGLLHIDRAGVATSFVLPAVVGNQTNHVAVGPAGVFASSISRTARTEEVTVSHLDGDDWTTLGTVELTRIEPSGEPDHFGLDQNGYPVVLSGTAYRALDGSAWIEPAAPYERTLTRPTVDGKGMLWALAGDAIWYLADGEWHVIAEDEGLYITGLAPRPEGGVWMPTWDQGVFVADTNGINQLTPGALSFWRTTAIVAGHDGSVWIAGNTEAGTELARWDGTQWTLVPVPTWDGAFDWVTCIAVGPDGAVWIGDGHETASGFGSGVARFGDDTWTRYGTESGLPSPDVYSIAVDGDGGLWVGTDAGVARITEPAPQAEEPPPAATTGAVYSIARHGIMPDPLPGGDEHFGSGCTPGTDTLPDGIWFGFVRDLNDTSIAFDLACLGWIADPNDDAIEEGGWDLSNTNPKIRDAPVAGGAQAACPWANCPQPSMAYAEWMLRAGDVLAANPDGAGVMVWLYVNGGNVTEIAEPVLAG